METLASGYGLDEIDAKKMRLRVAPIPVSIALAQAAIESGWGTSRFARAGNALFGQWAWDKDSGLTPRARREGATHKVRRFESLRESVRAHARKLYSHRAYLPFRRQRPLRLTANKDGIKGLSG